MEIAVTAQQPAPVEDWRPRPDEVFETWVERLAKYREEFERRPEKDRGRFNHE